MVSFNPFGLLAVGLIALLLKVAVFVGLVVLIVWAVRRSQGAGAQSPLDLLQARYARGEITREQYLQMRQDLISQ